MCYDIETLKSCGVAEDWERKAVNRETWKRTVWQGVERLKVERVQQRRQKRRRRKDPDAAKPTCFVCDMNVAVRARVVGFGSAHARSYDRMKSVYIDNINDNERIRSVTPIM